MKSLAHKRFVVISLLFITLLIILTIAFMQFVRNPSRLETPSKEETITSGCKTSGCSSELCIDEKEGNAISTCIFKAEYNCYKNAHCEKQTNGKCGWTQTKELQECIFGTTKYD